MLSLLRLVPETLVRCFDAHLKTLGDDAGFVALGPREVLVERVDEPGPEVQGVPLLLYGEALAAAAHHSLHELMRTDLCITEWFRVRMQSSLGCYDEAVAAAAHHGVDLHEFVRADLSTTE